MAYIQPFKLRPAEGETPKGTTIRCTLGTGNSKGGAPAKLRRLLEGKESV